MKNWLWWLLAGLIALAGGILGLVNPNAAQITSTTIAGWALVLMGLLQGRAAWKSSAFRERAGAGLFAAAGLFLGLSLLLGPFGDGTLLRWLLGGLLIVGGLAKLWIGRRYRTDPLFWAVVAAGALSVLLGGLVLLGVALQLGVILSLELLGSGAALVVMALRLEKPTFR
ncbi:MAG TPA: DUF308 domain-containing protein [Roseovarius sp.]|nr:DUF308 domain-containing protein [Roseovarius sp.]